MRKINLLIVGLIAAFIVSCNQSGKKTETDAMGNPVEQKET